MPFPSFLLALVAANLIYIIAFFAGSIRLKVSQTHYFLAGGPALFTLRIRGVKISVGLYLPAFSRIYSMADGKKERLKYPWEFQEHTIIRRLVVTLCGPIALVIAGTIVLIISGFTQNITHISRAEVNRLGIYPSATAEIAGFRRGDRVLKLNGEDYDNFYDLVDPAMLESGNTHYTVLRNGREINIDLSTLPEGTFSTSRELFISLLAPFTIREVIPNTPAAQAGLEPGDKITHVNGQPVIKYDEVIDAINSDTTGSVSLTIERVRHDSTHAFTTELTADSMVPGRNRIGILPHELIVSHTRTLTFTEGIARGFQTAWSVPISTTKGVADLLIGNPMERPIDDPKNEVKEKDVTIYLLTVGILAIMFAYANFLPMPRAAFWELIPLGYEAATKKQFAFNTFKVCRKTALILFITAVVLLLLADLFKLFF